MNQNDATTKETHSLCPSSFGFYSENITTRKENVWVEFDRMREKHFICDYQTMWKSRIDSMNAIVESVKMFYRITYRAFSADLECSDKFYWHATLWLSQYYFVNFILKIIAGIKMHEIGFWSIMVARQSAFNN